MLPSKRSFWCWHGSCPVKLGDKVGMVIVGSVGIVVAVKDLHDRLAGLRLGGVY